MPQIGIQQRDVRKAVEELEAEGRAASPTNVRLQLGGRGSYTTIQRLLAEVKRSLEEQRAVPSMSDYLLKTAGECITTLWSAAHLEAQRTVEALQRKHRVELESLKLELERTQTEAGRLEYEVGRVVSELAEERRRLASMSNAIAEATSRAHTFESAIDDARQRQPHALHAR